MDGFQSSPSSFIWSKIDGMDGRVGGRDPYSGSQTINRRLHNLPENPEGGRLGFFPPTTSSITVKSFRMWLYGRVPVNTCQRYHQCVKNFMWGIYLEYGHSQCIYIRAHGRKFFLHIAQELKMVGIQHLGCHPPSCTLRSSTTGGGPNS